MIVVDTNVLVYYYVRGDFTESAIHVHVSDPVWVAPYLWRSEFRNTLLLYLRKTLLTMKQVQQITMAAERRMHGYEFHVAMQEVYELAAGSSCSAYDCEYVVLARELGVPLVTADRDILHGFPDTAVSLQQFVDPR